MSWQRFHDHQALPVDAMSLGRFIVDIDDPLQDYHDPFSSQLPDAISYKLENYEASNGAGKGLNLGASAGSVAQASASKCDKIESTVQSDVVACYELRRWHAVFQQACLQEQTREWLEGALEDGNDVYFVVGFRTVLNPHLGCSSQHTTESRASFSIPVLAMLSAAPAGFLPVSVDPHMAAGGDISKEMAQSFRAVGEFVLAIRYCKLKFRWLSSRKLETSSLGKCRWKISWAVRGDQDCEEDVIDVSLEGVDEQSQEDR